MSITLNNLLVLFLSLGAIYLSCYQFQGTGAAPVGQCALPKEDQDKLVQFYTNLTAKRRNFTMNDYFDEMAKIPWTEAEMNDPNPRNYTAEEMKPCNDEYKKAYHDGLIKNGESEASATNFTETVFEVWHLRPEVGVEWIYDPFLDSWTEYRVDGSTTANPAPTTAAPLPPLT